MLNSNTDTMMKIRIYDMEGNCVGDLGRQK
jgi:hypothetical protein